MLAVSNVRCVLITVACGITLASCGKPFAVPTPAKTISLRGEEYKLDLGFLNAGTTRREEVLERLGWTDVGLHERYVFWGRWRSSSWKWIAEEHFAWQARNVLVEFDDSGRLRHYAVFGDEALVQAVDQWLSHEARFRLDLSQGLSVHPTQQPPRFWGNDTVSHATLTLARDMLEFRGTSNIVTIPAKNIVRLTCDGTGVVGAATLALHLDDGTGRSEFIFETGISETITLVSYLRQIRPSALE